MTFEQEIRKLCDSIVASECERETIELTRRMQTLLHSRIEELRGSLAAIPTVGPVAVELSV